MTGDVSRGSEWTRLASVALILGGALLAAVSTAAAQRPGESAAEREGRLARRGAGVRIGAWNVEEPTRANTRFTNSLLYELFIQRGLDDRLVLETSAGVWRRITRERQQLPAGSDTVQTKAYVIPLLTALKLYPFTTASSTLEPYILGGLGFAIGVEDESRNALGGGGTSIVTGFGTKAAVGLEVHVGVLSIAVDGRYQWIRLSESVGVEKTFQGTGIEGGLMLRFAY